jgi:hypothetical protein
LKEFDKYGNLFQDLTSRKFIDTKMKVSFMILSFTPKPVKQCLAVCKNDDETYVEL